MRPNASLLIGVPSGHPELHHNWVREVAPIVGGGGGGKPDMAQAGGKDASQIPAAIEKAQSIITDMLA